MDVLPQRVSLFLLADRQFRPAALRLKPVGEGLADMFGQPFIKELATKLPCLIAADDVLRLSQLERDAALSAGCQLADAGTIATLVHFGDPLGVPEATYLEGEWYLQALAKPMATQSGSRGLALKLLQLVASDADTREIEEIFRYDPTWSYHLLRLVNSPGIGNGRHIDNFTQAILLLGRRQLRRWLNLILFTSSKDDPRSAMLLAHVAVRARMLEQFVKEAGHDKDEQERAFMVGMFSLLGVMFGMPLADILKPLNLDPGVAAALLAREGELGALLAAVEGLEKGCTADEFPFLTSYFPAAIDIDRVFFEACRWMLELTSSSLGGAHG
jgi:EAL and modified HD-GYP domain-containing signal transduction protein